MILSSTRRLAGRVLERLGEAAAVALLRGLRPFSPPPATPLPPGPMRVLALVAHPDDETALAGGCLAAHTQRGDEVRLLAVTSGAGSRAGGLGPDEIRTRRAEELARAAAALGVREVCCLGLTELEWQPEEAMETVREAFSRADLVYTHSPVDFHPDHLAVCSLAAALAAPEQRFRLGEAQAALTPMLVNVEVPITPPLAAAKAAAAAAHATQRHSIDAVMRFQAVMRRAGGGCVEERFWELDGAAFRRMMASVTWRDHTDTPFRGFRLRGFTDPLAVLAGTRARLRLRRAAR